MEERFGFKQAFLGRVGAKKHSKEEMRNLEVITDYKTPRAGGGKKPQPGNRPLWGGAIGLKKGKKKGVFAGQVDREFKGGEGKKGKLGEIQRTQSMREQIRTISHYPTEGLRGRRNPRRQKEKGKEP